MTPLEIAKKGMRLVRNEAIALTDWAVLPDSALPAELKQKYIDYRQYLRNLPSTMSDDDFMNFEGIIPFEDWNV